MMPSSNYDSLSVCCACSSPLTGRWSFLHVTRHPPLGTRSEVGPLAVITASLHHFLRLPCRSHGGVSPNCVAKKSMNARTRGSISLRGGMTA